MSKTLEDLRQRSAATNKAVQEQKLARVKETVTEVVNGSSFVLSTLNRLERESATDEAEHVEKLAMDIATRVTEIVADPKIEFLDTLKARGLKESRIREAVTQINSIFGLTKSESYDDKLEAVALYLRNNPALYDDIAFLS